MCAMKIVSSRNVARRVRGVYTGARKKGSEGERK